jgi:hypothetical protein
MRAWTIGGLLIVRAAVGASSGGLPTGPETPSATDLLRAEHMATEAKRRLTPPPSSGRPTWKYGGEGWGGAPGDHVDEPHAPRR